MNRRGLTRLPTGGFSSVGGGYPVRQRLTWTYLGSSSSSLSSFFSTSSFAPSGNAYSPSRLYTTGPFFASPLPLSSSSSAPISPDASSTSSSTVTEGGENVITVEDALRGSQQAYYAVGLVLKRVIDGLEEEPPMDTPLEMEDFERQASHLKKQSFLESHTIIREVLRKHFLDESSTAATSSNPPSSPSNSSDNDDASSSSFKSSEQLEQKLTTLLNGIVKKVDFEKWREECIKSVMELQKVLPISDVLAIELVMLLITREALNVSCFDDFIFASSCVHAEVLPKAKPQKSEKEVKTSIVLCQSKALSAEELKKRSTRTPLIPKSGLTEVKSKESSEQAGSTEEKELTVRSFKVRHAVVTPPQRYNPMYSWFYERLIGYRSPNERIVVANLLAQLSNFAIFKGFDYLVRMFTRKPVQLPTGHFLRVIQNIAGEVLDHSVPIVYKDMTFSRNTEDGKWVLESITTHKSTDCVFVPKS